MYLFFSDNDDHDYTHGGSLYNGDSQVLYWADVSAEIAFVVPTLVSTKKVENVYHQHESGTTQLIII